MQVNIVQEPTRGGRIDKNTVRHVLPHHGPPFYNSVGDRVADYSPKIIAYFSNSAGIVGYKLSSQTVA